MVRMGQVTPEGDSTGICSVQRVSNIVTWLVVPWLVVDTEKIASFEEVLPRLEIKQRGKRTEEQTFHNKTNVLDPWVNMQHTGYIMKQPHHETQVRWLE